MYKTHTGVVDRPRTVGLRGLRNLGNTCYLNAIIQALSHANILNDLKDLSNKHPLIFELARVIETLWSPLAGSRWNDVVPQQFKNTLDRELSQFEGYEQHDSQELLVALVDIFIEARSSPARQEYVPDTCGPIGCRPSHNRTGISQSPTLNAVQNPPLYCQITDIDSKVLSRKTEVSLWQEQWTIYKLRYNSSKMTKLFQGFGGTRIQCCYCGEFNIKMEPVTSVLSVPVVTSDNECITTCEDAVTQYLSPELLEGDEAWFCPKCKCKRKAQKSMYIYKWPRIVVLHLKRFSWSPRRGFSKITHQVDLAHEPNNHSSSGYYIDLPRQFKSHLRYDLFAVVNHQGSYGGGHYQASCFHNFHRAWFEYCDSLVSKIVDPTTVVDRNSYLLFFRKNYHQEHRTTHSDILSLEKPRVYMRKERSCTSLQQRPDAADLDDDNADESYFDDRMRPQSEHNEVDCTKHIDFAGLKMTSRQGNSSIDRNNQLFSASRQITQFSRPVEPSPIKPSRYKRSYFNEL